MKGSSSCWTRLTRKSWRWTSRTASKHWEDRAGLLKASTRMVCSVTHTKSSLVIVSNRRWTRSYKAWKCLLLQKWPRWGRRHLVQLTNWQIWCNSTNLIKWGMREQSQQGQVQAEEDHFDHKAPMSGVKMVLFLKCKRLKIQKSTYSSQNGSPQEYPKEGKEYTRPDNKKQPSWNSTPQKSKQNKTWTTESRK